MNELISVIVTIYNIERYIEKCIISIINQTYKNIEIILVDDGSKDKSANICDEYEKKDRRIKVIHKENGGHSDARNTGLDMATGEYYMFVDGDDYIKEDMIERMYDELVKSSTDMVICEFQYVDEDGNYIEQEINKQPPKVILDEKIFWDTYMTYGIMVVWCKLFKKKCFENVRFPRGQLHEDEAVMHRLIGNCNEICYINERLYFYVQRNGSTMNKKISIDNLCYINTVYERINYLIGKKIYIPIGDINYSGIIKIHDYYVENRKMIKTEKIKFKKYCKIIKKTSFKVMFLKNQNIKNRIRAFVFWSGGIGLFDGCVNLKNAVKSR